VEEREADYFDYLDGADAVVMTSWDESLSMVILEAAALGKPFVSFASGGPQEIFRTGMGAIIQSWDPRDLASAMLRVMRGEIAVSPEACRRRARDFDVGAVVERWQSLLTASLAA
jgi:glycosyltransferase involved in cell wall biosynthesis